MSKPMIKIHNVQTGEIVEREMNAEEIAQMASDAAETQAQMEAEAAKAAEKVALLEQLGITADQAKLLLS
jgi:EAL domain-containing protein (putative c-di-GMP-specific phosphodiesterase class I)